LPTDQVCAPFVIPDRSQATLLISDINSLVPRGFPPETRADIAQDVMLALLEGKISLDDLKANKDRMSWFVTKFWRDNYERSGHTISLDATYDEEWNGDDVASSIAAKDWHQNELNDRRVAFDSMIGFQPPTQIEETFAGEVRRKWITMQEGALQSGNMHEMLSFREVAELMESAADGQQNTGPVKILPLTTYDLKE